MLRRLIGDFVVLLAGRLPPQEQGQRRALLILPWIPLSQQRGPRGKTDHPTKLNDRLAGWRADLERGEPHRRPRAIAPSPTPARHL